jgi:inward rectifier potassium channel
MRHRPKRIRPPGASYEIRIVNDHSRPLLDFYHGLMRLSWTATLLAISAVYLLVNALFALGYVAVGGVANAPEGGFLDAFFFSVQTMGTIGYGALYPTTRAANWLVVSESLFGLIFTALTTGLVFAKFSRPTARVVFTREAVISPLNGVPTLMFRLGNERGNFIVDAKIRLLLLRSETLPEGGMFYRMVDLKLVRDHALSLTRSWSVMHAIDESSPLYGQTPESVAAQDTELEVLMVGLDDTAMQTIHARHRYFAPQILWGKRHADVISESEDGAMLVDLRNFHNVEDVSRTPGFPYGK